MSPGCPSLTGGPERVRRPRPLARPGCRESPNRSPGDGTPDNQMCRWDSRQPDTEYDGRPGCSTAGQELLVDIGEEDGELVELVGMGGQVGVVADEVERDAPSESDQFEIGAE